MHSFFQHTYVQFFSTCKSGESQQSVVVINLSWRASSALSSQMLFRYKSEKCQGAKLIGLSESWGFQVLFSSNHFPFKEEQSSLMFNTEVLRDGQQYYVNKVLLYQTILLLQAHCFLKDRSVDVRWSHLIFFFIAANHFLQLEPSYFHVMDFLLIKYSHFTFQILFEEHLNDLKTQTAWGTLFAYHGMSVDS